MSAVDPVDIAALSKITTLDESAMAMCSEAVRSFEMFVRDPDFYKLDKSVIMAILDNVKLMRASTAKILVSYLDQNFHDSILEFISKIRVGKIGAEKAREIMESLLEIPLLRELTNDDSDNEEDCGFDLNYEFYYHKAKEEAEELRQQLADAVITRRDMALKIISKYRYGSKSEQAVRELHKEGNDTNSELFSILKEAIIYCNLEAVEAISPYIDLNCFYEEDYPTILTYACEFSSVEVINSLINHGALIKEDDDKIVIKALQNSPKVLEFIVKQPGVNLQKYGAIPIQIARRDRKTQMEQILLKADAQPIYGTINRNPEPSPNPKPGHSPKPSPSPKPNHNPKPSLKPPSLSKPFSLVFLDKRGVNR